MRQAEVLNRSGAYFEPAPAFGRPLSGHAFDLFDVGAELSPGDGFQKRLDLRRFSTHLKFHAPVHQIFHPSGHFIAGGQLFDRVPETDTLNLARIKKLGDQSLATCCEAGWGEEASTWSSAFCQAGF